MLRQMHTCMCGIGRVNLTIGAAVSSGGGEGLGMLSLGMDDSGVPLFTAVMYSSKDFWNSKQKCIEKVWVQCIDFYLYSHNLLYFVFSSWPYIGEWPKKSSVSIFPSRLHVVMLYVVNGCNCRTCRIWTQPVRQTGKKKLKVNVCEYTGLSIGTTKHHIHILCHTRLNNYKVVVNHEGN